MSQSYVKYLPLLVVHPCLSAQLFRILRLYMVAQCQLFYRCFHNQILNATVANRTLRLHVIIIINKKIFSQEATSPLGGFQAGPE